MTKKGSLIIILLIVLILGFFISPYSSIVMAKVSYNTTKSVNLSDLNIEGIKIRDNIKNVITKHGESMEDTWYNTKNMIKVRANSKNIIDMIVIEKPNLKVYLNTKEYLSLSSSKEEISNVLGDNYYKRTDNQGFSIRGYRDKNSQVDLEFWYLNNKLEKIQVNQGRGQF